jgi:hypothetical protein
MILPPLVFPALAYSVSFVSDEVKIRFGTFELQEYRSHVAQAQVQGLDPTPELQPVRKTDHPRQLFLPPQRPGGPGRRPEDRPGPGRDPQLQEVRDEVLGQVSHTGLRTPGTLVPML